MDPGTERTGPLQEAGPTITLDHTIPAPCAWCGRTGCAERFDHGRLYASSETAWRRWSP